MSPFALILFSLLSSTCCLFAVGGRSEPPAEGYAPGLLTAMPSADRSANKHEAIQPRIRKALTVEEFERDKYQTPAQEIAVSVPIHPSMSNYVLRLIPAPVDDPDRGLQPVGRIEILKSPSAPAFQTIQVAAEASTDLFIRCVEFVDINHDGYLDLMTLAEFGGAKWWRYQYWVFEPKSGRFISNWLTKRLSRFLCCKIRPDAQSGEIHVRYLVFDGVMDEGYRIQGRRLILVSRQEIKPNKNAGFILTTMRLIDGKMQVVKVEEVSEYPL